jgi:hypothetical protein
MAIVRLNPLDAAWVLTETRATPNHVGGLLQFRLPPGAPKDFLRQMLADFRGQRDFGPPWNRRLQFMWSVNPMPAWVEATDIDLEYHVRHAALPGPGGEREGAWEADCSLELQVVCLAEVAEKIAEHVLAQYAPNYAVALYLSDVQVFRAQKY